MTATSPRPMLLRRYIGFVTAAAPGHDPIHRVALRGEPFAHHGADEAGLRSAALGSMALNGLVHLRSQYDNNLRVVHTRSIQDKASVSQLLDKCYAMVYTDGTKETGHPTNLDSEPGGPEQTHEESDMQTITQPPASVKKLFTDDLVAYVKLGYTIRSGSRMGRRGGEPIHEWQLFTPAGEFVRTVPRLPVQRLFNAGYASAIHSYASGTLKGLHR